MKRTVRPHLLLKFGQGNSKLDPAIFTFSLPAGWSCPYARDCHARTDPQTGRVTDGDSTSFRCYSASDEVIRPSVRNARWHNLRLLRGMNRREMTRLILASLSALAGVVRVHVSGDFFSRRYLDAWLAVAKERPFTRFYWYTKSLRYWVRRLDEIGTGYTPGRLPNVTPTASWGGRDDALIERYGLRSAKVVLSEAEADQLGLELDDDDSHAMRHGPDFALLVHGVQPAGTPAAKAIASLRQQGVFGYGRRVTLPQVGG